MTVALSLVVVDGELSLQQLPSAINAAVTRAEQHARAAVQHALQAGAMLIQAKQFLPYGDFERWLLAHCTVAPRTARAYMRLATRMPMFPDQERQRVAVLPLRQAIAAIGTTADAPRRYTGEISEMGSTRPKLSSCARSLELLARDVGVRPVARDRIVKLRTRLAAAVAELDRMAGEAA